MKSTYFKLEEFTSSNTALTHMIRNEPNIWQVKNIECLCRYTLDPLRKKFTLPIIVNSGFRSEELNSKVGGVANSMHLLGRAADIRPVSPHLLRTLYLLCKEVPHTELKLYETFIHIAL